MTTLYKFKFYFTKEGVGTTPSTVPVCTVVDTDADTKLADEQAMNDLANLTGYYDYEYSGADDLDLVALAHTIDDTMDQQDLVAYTAEEIHDIENGLAVVDTNVDSILVDTGTTIPAAIDAVPTATETWAAASRTLTMTATEIESAVSGSTITQTKGDTWDFDIEDVTLDSNLIQLSIKSSKNDTDAESLVFIDTDTGLLYLNGAAATGVGDIPAAADGSLSYTGTTLTVTLKATASALLPYGSDYKYGLQSITAAGVVAESYGGTFVITDDVVDATS